MEKKITYEQALHKAAAYCSTQERCLREVRNKLTGMELNDSEMDDILRKLIQEKFIDEERYSRAFVRDKFRFNKWGRIKIKMALREKGIQSEMISLALEEINEDEYKELALSLLKDKSRTVRYSNDYDRRGKMVRFLLQKGFETDLVMRITE